MAGLLHVELISIQSRFSIAELDSESACRRAFDRLPTMSDDELAHEDIGLVNLLCAVGLPSADPLAVPLCMAQLDELAEYARQEIINGYPRYLANPNSTKGSESLYKLWALMHAVRFKTGIEAKYKRATSDEMSRREMPDTSMPPTGGPYISRVNSQTAFIHGLLSPRCLGCCASNPVLFAAIGRRLGFPVRLVKTPNHIFNRWVDDSEEFNMDGSMKRIGGDQYHDYVDRWRPWTAWERKSTAFHSPLKPREELAGFMFNRSNCESANLRFEDAMKSVKIAAELQPDHQAYVDEQSVIHQNHSTRQHRSGMSFTLPGHYPEIVTSAGRFSGKQIRI